MFVTNRLLGLSRWVLRRFPALLERSPLIKDGRRLADWRGPSLQWQRSLPLPGWQMLELSVSGAEAGAEAVLEVFGEDGTTPEYRFAIPLANGDLSKRLVYVPGGRRRLNLGFPDASGDFAVTRFRLAWVRDGFARPRVARRLTGIHPKWKHLGAAEAEAGLASEGSRWTSTVLPPYEQTFRRRTSGAGYDEWRENHPDISDDTARQWLMELGSGPRISVVMPVYDPQPEYLRACLESVLGQSWPHWQLCIADDASTDPEVKAILDDYQQQDDRIEVCFRPSNGHICAASNSALALAKGEFVALVDHDDLLEPHALLHVVRALRENPGAALLYSDEDKVDSAGAFYAPHFKADWNPELILAQNYISHLGVYRRDLVMEIGGFREGYEGAQDHDLLLRCVAHLEDPESEVVHIPRVLYHWRASEGSTALAGSEKSYAEEAGLRAVNDYLAGKGEGARAVSGEFPNTYRVHYPMPEPAPLVSLLVPTRNGVDILRPCVDAILERTGYRNFELLILDNQSDCPETLAYMEEVARRDERVRVLRWDYPFNYSSINNFGARQARGSLLGLINNDIEPLDGSWLSEMVSQVVRSEVGCVGAKLYYPNDKLQHGGVILGLGGVAGHSHKFADRKAPGYFYRLMLAQNLSAVTGACLLVRKEVFWQVGGLDEEHLAIAFNDVDLCLKVREAGYRNVWTPHAEAYHHESVSRGKEDTPEKQARFASEIAWMKQRWHHELQNDPAYNPNLTKAFEDFSLG
ncbi:glycosyltransferase family 2 protein [Marinobacter bryozoorum]|uniref:glycosyltransferase family 2 protein n=1 Tax=Marinobacter bryozoorum TaxID=256324 RepID=UPI002004D486|nr:glycosyltransferase family 2 protein [Marinobacter bryozoorum]MCK7544805.1 glycosyltransferase family 2 protein [Marinobacter bryozoorum]